MLRTARPGGRLRRQQLPVRVLRGRRRHRLRAGRRLPGGRQGPRRPTRLTSLRSCRGDRRRAARRRRARRRARRWSTAQQAGARTWSRTRAIRAVGFTGSLGGRARPARHRRAARRTRSRSTASWAASTRSSSRPAAAAARGDEIAAGLFGSFTRLRGQFCTKPGAGVRARRSRRRRDRGVAARPDRRGAAAHVLLNQRIAQAFDADRGPAGRRAGRPDGRARPRAEGRRVPAYRPVLLVHARRELSAERRPRSASGRSVVVARYDDADGPRRGAGRRCPHSLTATVHAEDDETDTAAELAAAARAARGPARLQRLPDRRRGSSWAQHHGGPWPSTNSPAHLGRA